MLDEVFMLDAEDGESEADPFPPGELLQLNDREQAVCPECGEPVEGVAKVAFDRFRIGWDSATECWKYDVIFGGARIIDSELTRLYCDCGWSNDSPPSVRIEGRDGFIYE